MNLLYLIIVICLLYKEVFNGQINPCLIAQECQYSGEIIPCSEHGICFYDLFKYVLEDSTNKKFIDCVCDIGYITLNDDDKVKCCYEQKLQKYALLLELLPFGFGHYYAGRMINFWIKFIFEVILLLSIIIFGFCYQNITKKRRNKGYEVLSDGSNKNDAIFNNTLRAQIDNNILISNALFYISCILLIVWQGIDLFLFGLNIYSDENSVELKMW